MTRGNAETKLLPGDEKMTTTRTITAICIHYQPSTDSWAYRLDRGACYLCEKFAGWTPASDSITDIQAAVVAIAHDHGIAILESDVAVDGLHGEWAA